MILLETLDEHQSTSFMLKNTNLYLIGMMGSGKSTVGQHLATALGYQFFDTDALIMQITRQTIPELFATGEPTFRAIETQVLAQLTPHTRLVVATGGGVVTQLPNWAYLHTGIVVWLEVPSKLLWQRLSQDTTQRPLLQTSEHLAELFKQREALYRQADVIVQATACPERVCEQVLIAIQERLAQDASSIPVR